MKMAASWKDKFIFPTRDAEPCDISNDDDFELRLSDTSEDNDSAVSYDVNENVVSLNELSKNLNREEKKCLHVSNRKLSQGSTAVLKCECFSTNDEIHSMLYKILSRLLSTKVVIQKLPESVIQQYRSNSDKTSVTKTNDKDVQIEVKYWRYCPICDLRSEGSASKKCKKCRQNVLYVCKKCNKRLKTYTGIVCHLQAICDIQGYNHCPECDYKHALKCKIKLHIKNKHPNVMTENNLTPNKSCKPRVKTMAVQCCIKCHEEIRVGNLDICGPNNCDECGSAMVYKCLKCGVRCSSHSVIVCHLGTCYNLKEN